MIGTMGSGALVVQLPQPYLIETMRFLLWDCDDRCYSFYVEVSIDQIKWTKVVEFNECKSWQIAQFERISVVFVKIVGTYNSANEVFHCVHFECPAMDINEAVEEERMKKVQNVKASVTDYCSRASTSNISNDRSNLNNKQENGQFEENDKEEIIKENVEDDEQEEQNDGIESIEELLSDN
uniref:F5/8 type C domain-containing protein n=1 Tax=Meloidogyne incognita TaxID=6306 RepID=A0A914NXW8_MELIC